MEVGIVQMLRPERECLGGVLKKDIIKAYGSKYFFINVREDLTLGK